MSSVDLSNPGTVGFTQDAAGNTTVPGNVTLPAAGVESWATRAKVTSPVDGQVQITNAAGAAVSLTTGVVLGVSTGAGSSLVYDSTAGLRSMNANQTANSGWAGTTYVATNPAAVNFGVSIGLASQCGLGFATTTSVQLVTNNTVALNVDASQNINIVKAVQVQTAGFVRSGAASPNGSVTGVNGDIYMATGGASGARLWVCAGGTVWAAVAGV